MINKKEYLNHKEEYDEIIKESKKKKEEELKGLQGHAKMCKIHRMRKEGRW